MSWFLTLNSFLKYGSAIYSPICLNLYSCSNEVETFSRNSYCFTYWLGYLSLYSTLVPNRWVSLVLIGVCLLVMWVFWSKWFSYLTLWIDSCLFSFCLSIYTKLFDGDAISGKYPFSYSLFSIIRYVLPPFTLFIFLTFYDKFNLSSDEISFLLLGLLFCIILFCIFILFIYLIQ